MLGQFSYRGGKDLDTGQKTVSPLRAFPFSFFFSPLFFFFFAARLRMHSGLCHFVFVFRANSRPRFSLRCALPQTALLKSALLPLSTATRRRSSPSCLFELRFPSLLRHSSSRWFDHILRKRRDRDPSFSQKGMKNLWNEARQGRGVYWPSCSV